jgi:hypothetical protein
LSRVPSHIKLVPCGYSILKRWPCKGLKT